MNNVSHVANEKSLKIVSSNKKQTTNALNSSINQGHTSKNSANSNLFEPQRKKKGKPLSMNETLLNKIVHEVVKKPTNNRNIPACSLTRQPENNQGTIESIKNVSAKVGSYLGNQSKSSTNFNKSITKKSHGSLNLQGNSDIPLPTKNLTKNPSNGLETTFSQYNKIINPPVLKPEISLGSLHIYTERESNLNMTMSSTSKNKFNLNNSFHNHLGTANVRSFKTETFKLNEDLLEYKLNNSKLKNEINILNEKMKTLKQVVNMKNSENDLIRTKYTELMEEYKQELEKMKKTNNEYRSVIECNEKKNTYIKSTLSVMLELFEIFISPRFSYPNNMMTRQSVNPENISASYSIDIYDSYNNDEDKRNTMIEQIQGLLVAKLNVIKRNLSIDLDKEIERVKNWNVKVSNTEINVSSLISNLKMSKINDSAEKSNSNDLFDLSTSNQFIMQSPKFNSELSLKIKETENINNFSLKKDEDNQILNDSFLKELKQNDSFSEDKNGSLIMIHNNNFNSFSNLNTNEKKFNPEMNIIDCSVIDLNGENKMTPTNSKMMFNDNPTEFNIEMKIASNNNLDEDEPTFNIITMNNNLNTTFQNEDDVKTYENFSPNEPVVLNPMINNDLCISFEVN